ncbi:hypothetical protein ACW5W4_08790 [Aeromonas crassostreae]
MKQNKRQARSRHLWFSHWNAPRWFVPVPSAPEPAVPHSSR